MADQYGQFDVASARRIGEVVRYVEAMMRGGGVPPSARRDHGIPIKLARTTAAHAAGATQAVNLCDADFVEFSPAVPVDAVNDFSVSIPDAATKIFIARIAGKWRILNANVCTE